MLKIKAVPGILRHEANQRMHLDIQFIVFEQNNDFVMLRVVSSSFNNIQHEMSELCTKRQNSMSNFLLDDLQNFEAKDYSKRLIPCDSR